MHFIDGIDGVLFKTLETSEYDGFLMMGILFLRNVLGEPPEGSVLEIAEINDYIFDRLIVLAFDEEPEGAEMYALRAEYALGFFAHAVNWNAITRQAVIGAVNERQYSTEADLWAWLQDLDEPE